MGSICTTMAEEDKKDARVTDALLAQQHRDNRVKKLLLLGAGGSGKSTFFKQLQHIHYGFSDKERMSYKSHINHQIIEQMKRLIHQSQEFANEFPQEYGDCRIRQEAVEAAERFELIRDDSEITDEVKKLVQLLWQDEGIQQTYAKRSRFGVIDSSAYFFNQIDRIGAPYYLPTADDVLYVRHRTTGVVDKSFQIDKSKLRIFDVGGQRAERKKWIHCFDGVTAVIYVASLSGYDEAMYEEETENVMHDSLNLFTEVCNGPYFRNTAMILFLNKVDLFKIKIDVNSPSHVPLTVCFPEYNGGNTMEECLKYIREQFIKCDATERKKIFIHVTCAMDSQNVERVFNDVNHIVIEFSLKEGGLI